MAVEPDDGPVVSTTVWSRGWGVCVGGGGRVGGGV